MDAEPSPTVQELIISLSPALLTGLVVVELAGARWGELDWTAAAALAAAAIAYRLDRKSTRLNSSHANISYAVFCLKKKKNHIVVSVDKPAPGLQLSSHVVEANTSDVAGHKEGVATTKQLLNTAYAHAEYGELHMSR